MMQCIQNALDAGYITPDEARALNNRIAGLLREGLAAPEVKARMVERLSFEAQEAERVALIQEERRQILTDLILNHKNARGENDPAEALWMLVERHHAANFVSVAEQEAVIRNIVYAEGEAMFHEFRKRFWRGDTKAARARHAGRLKNVLHEVMESRPKADGDETGGNYMASTNKTGDPTARAYAEAWIKISEYLRRRYNAAGGHIGKLYYGWFPQSHDPAALSNAGGDPTRARQFWVDYMMQPGVLDRNRMVSATTGARLTDDELRTALSEVWQRIVTDGWIDADPTYSPIGRGALANRHAADRFLHFKDADAWIAYHKEFGKGDVYDAMTGHIRKMTRDIAVMEIFGPNPEAMRNYLKKLVNKAAATARPAATIIGEETQKLRDLLATASPRTGDNERVINETRKVLNELAELHRRLGAGGSRKKHLETQVAHKVERLAGLREELNNLRAVGMDQREADLIRQLNETDGKINQIKLNPAKGKRAKRRQRAQLTALTQQADRMRSELDDMRVGYDDLATRVADLETRLAEKRQTLEQREELAARMRRDLTMQWPSPDRPPPPDPATTQRLRDEISQLEQELAPLRPTVQQARPRVHQEMINVIDAMKRDMDDLAVSASRDLEPVEALLEDFNLRLKRFQAERADRQIEMSGRIEQAEARLGRVGYRIKGQAFDIPVALFASMVQAVRQGRVANDPELRARLEADLKRAIDEYGEELDAIGIGMDELQQALMITRQARPLFEVPQGFRSVKDPIDAARRGIGQHDRFWDVLRGNAEVPESQLLANVGRTTRNLLTSSLLGTAVVTALGDVVLQRRVRMLMGMPPNTLKILGGTINAMRGLNRREATRAMLMLDSALHIEHQRSRYTDDFDASSWSGYFADRVINISGLASFTQGGKHYVGMMIQGEMADRVRLRFDELHPDLQKTMRDSGITSADWDFMRRAKLHEPHEGVTFLRPNDIMAMPDGQAIGEKYLAHILRMTTQAVPEGSIRSRAWFAFGKPGTVGGEIIRSFAHFKTFPVMVSILHLGGISREIQAGNYSRAVGQTASLFVTATIAGALINELRELIDGRQPMLPTNLANGEAPGYGYWFAAAMRGGGFGIVGDLAFGGIDRLGGLSATFTGPAIGLFDKIRNRSYNAVAPSVKEPNPGRAAALTIKNLTPGQNLWFSRLLTDRLVFDQIQGWLDPEYDAYVRRRRQGQRKNYGNEFYWGPGELTPEMGPFDFGQTVIRQGRFDKQKSDRDRKLLRRALTNVMSDDEANALLEDIDKRGLTKRYDSEGNLVIPSRRPRPDETVKGEP